MDWNIYILSENFDLGGALLLTFLGVWCTVVYAWHVRKGKGGVK